MFVRSYFARNLSNDHLAFLLFARRVTRQLVGLLLIVAIGQATLALAQTVNDDEDNGRVVPGMIANYFLPNSDQPLFTRYDAAPAFLLQPSETPDPRLPAKGWRVEWKGVLQVLHPGKHRFFAKASGKLDVALDGQPFISGTGNDLQSAEIDLKFGRHPLVIKFTPSGETTELKFHWQAEAFVNEPLPSFAVGHEKTDPPVKDVFPHGRLQVEEHSCVACHAPSASVPISKDLLKRPGPKLTDAGTWTKAGYIYHWLANPQHLRPEAVMPQLFGDNENAKTERFAIARYLTSHGKMAETKNEKKVDEIKKEAKAGEKLFQMTGCIVCHEKQGERPAHVTLNFLGQKSSVEMLAKFIENPQEHDLGGRMPGFAFQDHNQTLKLAYYLTSRDPTDAPKLELPEEPTSEALVAAFATYESNGNEQRRFSVSRKEQQYLLLAKTSMRAKHCTNCHELNVKGEEKDWLPTNAKADFAAICAQPDGGCVAKAVKPKNDVSLPANNTFPVYGSSLQRDTAIAFLKQAAGIPGTSAPGEFARLTMERLNCVGCHTRNGRDGLDKHVVEKLSAGLDPNLANAETVGPPTLTGVAEKLMAGYIDGVLLNNQRSRPWMSLQMPKFQPDHVRHLSKGLAALDGDTPKTAAVALDFDGKIAEAGRTLVGEKGFGCIKCHDMLGIASSGTRGPDLAQVTGRVSYEWYQRWLQDPQRIQPGTRMPTVFLNHQSPFRNIVEGDPVKQREALWVYFQVASRLPRPEGLKPPQKVHAPDSDRPLVLRTFLPNTSARGIAIRYPNGVHLAYDAQVCRLAYSWAGDFLDLNPTWEGRGGNKANLEGATFWTSPEGFPWEVMASSEAVPDFSGRATNTAFGFDSPKPEMQPASRVHFKGYKTDGLNPTLNYTYDLAVGGSVAISETPSTLRSELATGVERLATVKSSQAGFAWLHVAVADARPRWRTLDGKMGTFSEVSSTIPASGALNLLQQGHSHVLMAKDFPAGTIWQAIQRDKKWTVLLRVPLVGDNGETKFAVTLWSPIDDKAATAEKVLIGLGK